MVARGDLGIECPMEELPIIQRRTVMRCIQKGRQVIVATHMLESMIENPLPTRAEITDVANAVFEQADAIMLSGETTVGKYPIECVQVFDRVARRMEQIGGAGFHGEAETIRPSATRLSAPRLSSRILFRTRKLSFLPGADSWRTISASFGPKRRPFTPSRRAKRSRAVLR